MTATTQVANNSNSNGEFRNYLYNNLVSFDTLLSIEAQQKWSNILVIDISIKQILTVFRNMYSLNKKVYIGNVNFKILQKNGDQHKTETREHVLFYVFM